MTRDAGEDLTPIMPIPRLLDDGEQVDRSYGVPTPAGSGPWPEDRAPRPFHGPVPPPLRQPPVRTVPGPPMVPGVPTRRPKGPSLRVDWPACKGHGLCAELLPERFTLDEWHYPIVDGAPLPADLLDVAKRAVASCPTLALRLVDPPS